MVDRVPGVCYVATLFFHINLVPLVPLRSYIIVEPSRRDYFYGEPIPLAWRSVLMAWLRAGLLGTAGASGAAVLLAYTALKEHHANEVPLLISAAILTASGFLFVPSMLTNRAGFTRAVELGSLLGIQPLEMEQTLATARQSLRGLIRWYMKSFNLDGSPKPLSSLPAYDLLSPSQSGRLRQKE
jgi:hypothetical protein